MKARTRVAAAILAFAALPLILVNWTALRQRQSDAARTADLILAGNADEVAALLASTRSRWLESVRADAQLPVVEDMLTGGAPGDAVRMSRFFAAIGSRDTVNINAIGLLDLEGRVLQDSRAVNVGRDESRLPWVTAALASGQPQLIGPLVSEGEDAPGLYAVSLVRDALGQRVGLLRIRLEPALVGQVVGSAMLSWPALSATVVDADGRVVAGVGELGGALALPGAERPSDGPPRVIDVGAERVAVAAVPGAPWWVAVRQSRADWAVPQRQLLREWLLQTALLLGLLLGASVLLGRRIAGPLARFSAVAERMARGDFSPVEMHRGADEARQLSQALDGLAARLRDTIGSLSHELAQRREAESALRRSREEFLVLVEQLPCAVYRCANRPGWPMDYLSPQVEALTGFAPEALTAGDGQGFTALMAPEDIAANESAVAEAMRQGGRYEMRYRIRHRDGDPRWVWELGSVQLGPDGAPTRLTGVLFDVTAEATVQQAMGLLRGRLDAQVGGGYFTALAAGLARVLDAESVLIGRFRGTPPRRLCSLALADRRGGNEQIEFDIAGTPSAAVLAEGRVDCGDGVQARFPDDRDLAHRGIRAYVGRRLDDSDGRPIGVLAVLDTAPMRTDESGTLLLDLFQARAAAELERTIAEEDLQRLADTLEARVAERTAELEATNASLSQAMDQLVQREKLASLGSLVAGVAHELNTPIGNALTVSTAMHDLHAQFAADLAAGQLKRSALERFVQDNDEAARLIERNLQRAATLITHFKHVAVDQASVRRRRFDLAELVAEVLSTLSPRLKRLPHAVQVDIAPGIVMDSYPGPLEQVLTNLVENSLVHGLEAGRAGRIRIGAEARDGRVRLRFEDDGRGIATEVRHRIFDPFFTTRLGQGGSGLGLYLVFNLVTGRLGGSIHLVDCDGPGTCFLVDLPAVAPHAKEDPSP